MLGVLNSAIENTNLVPVQNFYVAFFKNRHGVVIKICLLVFEKTIAFAHTATALLLVYASTALYAVFDWFQNSFRKFKRLISVLNVNLASWSHTSIVKKVSRAMKEHPRCWKTGMTSTYYNNFSDLFFLYCIYNILETLAFQKVIRKHNPVRSCQKRWKPFVKILM